MDDLINALKIFKRYGNPRNPCCCEHDTLYICGIDPAEISLVDKKVLERLGFLIDADNEEIKSFRFGSC